MHFQNKNVKTNKLNIIIDLSCNINKLQSLVNFNHKDMFVLVKNILFIKSALQK